MVRVLLAGLLAGLFAGVLPSQSTLVTQSLAPNLIEPLNSVSCNYLGLGTPAHLENHYLRLYRPQDLPVGQHNLITAIRVGVLEASSISGSQPLEVRLHRVLAGQSFPLQLFNYPQVASGSAVVLNTATSIFVEIPLDVPLVFDASMDSLLVDVVTPGDFQDQQLLFMGANSRGETNTSYTFAQGCGLGQPAPLAFIGWPSTHWIIDLVAWTDAPLLAANQSTTAGGLQLAASGLLVGNDLLHIASGELCPQGLGQGPWLGLCAMDPTGFLPFFDIPVNTRPLRFTATQAAETQMELLGLPSGLVLEAILIDLTNARFGPVARLQVP